MSGNVGIGRGPVIIIIIIFIGGRGRRSSSLSSSLQSLLPLLYPDLALLLREFAPRAAVPAPLPAVRAADLAPLPADLAAPLAALPTFLPIWLAEPPADLLFGFGAIFFSFLFLDFFRDDELQGVASTWGFHAIGGFAHNFQIKYLNLNLVRQKWQRALLDTLKAMFSHIAFKIII